MNFSGHHYTQDTQCTVSQICSGSSQISCWDIYHSKETLFQSGFGKRKLKRTATGGLKGLPRKFVQHIAVTVCIPPLPAGPPGASCSKLKTSLVNVSLKFKT